MIRKTAAAILAAIMLCNLTECERNIFRSNSGAAWGTVYHITYTSPKDLGDSIVAVINSIDNSLSTFNPNSTLTAVNNGDSTVDRLFSDVFEIAKYVHSVSHGAFDPTVGPLVEIWGFGNKGADLAVPDSSEIAEVLTRVGFDKCRLQGMTIQRDTDSIHLDFAAVAKGYGVDCVAHMLKRNGVNDFLVEIGGEIVTCGKNPSGRPWRVQIDAPSADALPGQESVRVITLENAAVATSGNYRNYRDLENGKRIGHTIDPISGYPVSRTTLSATVIAPGCGLADGLATACMVLPADSALAMINDINGVHALLVLPDTILTTPGFPDR